MLTDAEIVLLLSRDGSREDMLKLAFRMGMLRAAEVCADVFTRLRRDAMDNVIDPGDEWAGTYECVEAIRAEANAAKPERSAEVK